MTHSNLVAVYDDLLTSGVYGPWTHADFVTTGSASLADALPDNWGDPLNYSMNQAGTDGGGSAVVGPVIGDGYSVSYIPLVAEAAARLDALSAAWGETTPDWTAYTVIGNVPSPAAHINLGDMVGVVFNIRVVSTYWFPGGSTLTVPISAPWLDFSAGSGDPIGGEWDGAGNLVATPSGFGGGGDTTGYTIGLSGQVISTAPDDLILTLGPGNGHSGSLFCVQGAGMGWTASDVPPPPPPGYVPPGPLPRPNDLTGKPGARRLQFDERR